VYVLFYFHEVAKNIQTDEVGMDVIHTALATLKKDASGKWKITLLGYL
jgi:hypothetical protein